MEWTVVSERRLYADQWLDVRTADVELPDGRHLDHRLIRMRPAAGGVVVDGHRRALLIWRHRFITSRWGWEIPMGRVEDDEAPDAAAAREIEEETGWRPGPMRPLIVAQPSAGIMDSAHHVFTADRAVHIGDPIDAIESARVEWVPLADVPLMIARQEIIGSTSMAALLLLSASQGR